MTLTSPSGSVIDRTTSAADLQHGVGPTFESYHLNATEPGTWTVHLYGAQVAPQGEPKPTTTAGAGSLSYDAATDTYSHVWKTETGWAGTCRTFSMTLNDGSSHQATFRFVR